MSGEDQYTRISESCREKAALLVSHILFGEFRSDDPAARYVARCVVDASGLGACIDHGIKSGVGIGAQATQ